MRDVILPPPPAILMRSALFVDDTQRIISYWSANVICGLRYKHTHAHTNTHSSTAICSVHINVFYRQQIRLHIITYNFMCQRFIITSYTLVLPSLHNGCILSNAYT